MAVKALGERIADVLIEDGLLLPNQFEEATEVVPTLGPGAGERDTLFLFFIDCCAHGCLRNRLSSRPKEQVEC